MSSEQQSTLIQRSSAQSTSSTSSTASTPSTPSIPSGEVAVVFGSTGACGKHVLANLLESPEVSHVYSFVRKPTNRFTDNPKHHEIVMSQPDATLPLSAYNKANFPQTTPLTAEQLANDHLLAGLEKDLKNNWPTDHVDVVFSGLATTIKAAGSEDRMFTIDYKMNDLIATYAKEKQVPSYYLISSVGANSLSKFFYMRVKGQLDDRIKAINFVHSKVYRPGVLIGGERTEFRLGEWILENLVAPLYPTSCSSTSYFGQIAPIDVKNVARSMVSDYLQFRYEKNMNLAQLLGHSTQPVDLRSNHSSTPSLHSVVEGSGDIMQRLHGSEQFLQHTNRTGQSPAKIELAKASL